MIAHNPLQAGTDRNKELIPGHVPEAVVDALEAVHVNEDQGVRLAVSPRLPERLIEPFHQQPPDGTPSLMTAAAVYATGMVMPFLSRKRASSSLIVRPERIASRAGPSR